MTSSPRDAALVEMILLGDHGAFDQLVTRYRDTYTRFAVRMLGDRADAADVLQGAWLRALRNLHQCRDPDRFQAWFYSIVVNECRTFASRRNVRERRYDRDAEMAQIAAVDVRDSGLQEEIELALAALPADQREAFVMKHVEALSYDEIAAITGVGVSALKMRVKRACDRLRFLLEEVHHG
jgi:RNA polymerase sigma-70 factor, ECF subfamily